MKRGIKLPKIVDDASSKIFSDDEFIGLKELYYRLKLKYKKTDIINLLEREEHYIPLSIFNKKLGSLEVITKYLVENRNLSLKQISILLNRSNKNIWNSYNNSKKKFSNNLTIKDSILLPLSSLKDSKYTLLENIVSYLKDSLKLNYHKIAVLLHRDDRTIWTIYHRYKKKKSNG